MDDSDERVVRPIDSPDGLGHKASGMGRRRRGEGEDGKLAASSSESSSKMMGHARDPAEVVGDVDAGGVTGGDKVIDLSEAVTTALRRGTVLDAL
jgi:hypothetical protein